MNSYIFCYQFFIFLSWEPFKTFFFSEHRPRFAAFEEVIGKKLIDTSEIVSCLISEQFEFEG